MPLLWIILRTFVYLFTIRYHMQMTLLKPLYIAVAAGSMLISLPAAGQTTLSLRDAARLEQMRPEAQRKVAANQAEAGRVTVLMTLEADDTPTDKLAEMGLEVSLRMGRRLIATAPVDAVEQMALCKGVVSLSLDSEVKPLNNLARTETGVDALHAGEAVAGTPFTGKGVLTGIVDRGFDTNHIMYRDDEGNTRIKLIAMYPASSGSLIHTTPEEIESFGYDYAIMTHGSHVLGIMAGNAPLSDGNVDYSGVAPESDIAIASGILTEANIIAGMEQIYNLAQEKGQPCVINISQGTSWGPHDGSDTFSAMLNDMAGREGLTVVMAAGNEGALPIAVTGTFSEENPMIQTALEATENALYTSNVLSQGLGDIDVWSEDATPVEVEFVLVDLDNPDEPLYVHPVPEGDTPSYIGTGRAYMGELKKKPTDVEPFRTNYSNGYLGGRRGLDASSGRYRCELRAYLTSRSEELQKRVVALVRVKGEPGKRVFIYNENDCLAFSNYGKEWIAAPTSDGTISNICCGKNIIVAGSYAIRNVPESPYTVEELGKVTSTSSWGRLADGRLLPDVVTPGHLIFSTLNGAMTDLFSYDTKYAVDYPKVDAITDAAGKKHFVTQMGGTSMASPFCAGVVALMLQANPDLSSDAIRTILHDTALPIDGQGANAGSGKICPIEAVKAAYELNSLHGVVATDDSSIAVTPAGDGRFKVYAPGENALKINVFDAAGVMQMTAHAATDSAEIDLSSLAKGVYFVSVAGSVRSSVVKVLR